MTRRFTHVRGFSHLYSTDDSNRCIEVHIHDNDTCSLLMKDGTLKPFNDSNCKGYWTLHSCLLNVADGEWKEISKPSILMSGL